MLLSLAISAIYGGLGKSSVPGSHLWPLELPGLLWVPESCIFNTLRVILVCGRDASHLSLSVLLGNINKTQDLQTSGELLSHRE